jgi:hypothetical protein
MAASKRTLAAFAAGALLVPLSPFANPAFADHIEQRTIDSACPEDQVSKGNYPEDVPADSGFFEREINCVTDYGIATGRAPGDFDREFNVTRRQMAQFVYREALLGGVEFDTTTDPGYIDDDGITGEARDAIWGLTNAGIVRGVGGNRYNPNGDVSRAQMATFLVGLAEELGLTGFETTQDFFDDDDNLTPHEANINRIASEGVTFGQGGDRVYGFDNPVLRQQMAAFLARMLDIAVEQGVIESIFDQPQGDLVTVTTDAGDVERGDSFTITVAGEDIESVTISGDCIATDTFTSADDTDGSTTNDSFDFTVTVNEDAAAGNCNITVTTSFTEESGLEDETDTVNVNVLPGPTAAAVTDAPELVNVEFVRETTNTTTSTQQTTVRFTFDEDVTNALGAAGLFHLVGVDSDDREDGDSVTRESGNIDSVLVIFQNVTQDEFNQFSVATVDTGAVTDVDGDTNPEGDIALNADTTFAAGTTQAPDLVSVGNFRPEPVQTGQTASTATLADFTFDEAAFIVSPAGFELILDDNTEVNCTPSDDNTTTGTDSGDGTTTITVECANTEFAGGDATDVVRGVVLEDTVSDEEQTTQDPGPQLIEGDSNPMMTTEGTTVAPNLVSVTFNDTNDQATFVFDDTVTATDGTLFNVYTFDGEEVDGASTIVDGTSAPSDNQVVVQFPTGVLEDATGASVDEGAVTEFGGSATNQGDVNQEDEVGVRNLTVESGQTTGPDLIDVTRQINTTTTTDPNTGQQTTTENSITITFVFDETVGTPVNGEFFVVGEDGTRTPIGNCVNNDTSTTDVDNEVECTVQTNNTNTNGADDAARDAAVGTVDDGAVTDDSGNTNPEGAEIINA